MPQNERKSRIHDVIARVTALVDHVRHAAVRAAVQWFACRASYILLWKH